MNKNFFYAFTFVLAAFALILSSGSVFAVDCSESCDYSGNNNNISQLTGAVYNTTNIVVNGMGGLITDGVNDFATIQPNNTAMCSFTPTTPWTVNVKLNIPVSMSGGVFLKWCYDATTATGGGYMLRSSTNNRLGANAGSGFVQGTNTSWSNITLNQEIYIQYVYHGNNTLTIHYSNASNTYTAYNSTFTGQYANTTSSEANSTTIGAQNAGALQLRASFTELQINMVAMSADELKAWRNGSKSGLNTPNTTNLTALYKFINQSSANITINPAAPIRNLQDYFFGAQTNPSPITEPMWCDTSGTGTNNVTCNYTEALTYFNITTGYGAGLGFLRKPIDFSNVVASLTTGQNATWNVITGTGQIAKNINIHRSALRFAVDQGRYVVWGIDDIATQLANNQTECNYGVSAGGYSAAENQQTCDPVSNGTLAAGGRIMSQLTAQFLVDVGCFNSTSGVCALEFFNEPYLRQFAYSNNTAVPESGTCSVRTGLVNARYAAYNPVYVKEYLTAWGYNTSWIRFMASPSFYQDNTCARAMGLNWSTTYPYGSTYGADLLTKHTYAYGTCGTTAVNNLRADNAQDETDSATGNYTGRWWQSEGNIDCEIENTNNTMSYMSNLAANLLDLLNNTQSQAYSLYKDSSITTEAYESSDYIMFRGSALSVPQGGSVTINNVTLTGAYYVMKTFNTLPYVGTTLYPCSATDTDVLCVYMKKNSTTAYVFLNNYNNPQRLDIDNLTVTGETITSVKRMTQGLAEKTNTTETVTSGYADLLPLYPLGIAAYEITMDVANVSLSQQPGYLVNISEPNSQQFNISITNPDSQSYTVTWIMNSTNQTSCYNASTCTFTGGYTTAGNYNITATVVAETNTVNATWLLQINQTNQNISATYTPASPTSVTVGAPTAFAYTLTNPENTSYTSTWTNNGTNLTACYNSSGCSITFSTATTFNISVSIAGTTNTLSNDWSVTSVNPVTPQCNTANNLGEGLGRLPASLAVGGSIIVLFLIVGAFYVWREGTFSIPALLITCVILTMFIVVAMLFVGASAGTVNNLANLC